MSRQVETELPVGTQSSKENGYNPPHGVSQETYEIIIYARDHKEILDKVDLLDKGKRIINPTRNLIVIYCSTEASLRDVAKSTGGGKGTNAKRILRGLEIIWEQLPDGIQVLYPKEKAVRLKKPKPISSRENVKRGKTAKSLWENQEYRNKTVEALKERKDDPEFIARMRQISQGRLSPMEGRTHSQETIAKITKVTQENWNKLHGIETTDDPLTKRKALLAEWIKLTRLLKHVPSSKDIIRLKKEGKTRFSTTMYRKEFGEGSFIKAKKFILEHLSSERTKAVVDKDENSDRKEGKTRFSTTMYRKEFGEGSFIKAKKFILEHLSSERTKAVVDKDENSIWHTLWQMSYDL